MNRLLNMMKAPGSAVDAETYTLDDLWEKATAIGEKVQVNGSIGTGRKSHEVEIHFKRSTGSVIYATGNHTDIRQAFILAIEEAITLGAKPK